MKFVAGGCQDKVDGGRNLPLLGRLPEGGKGMSETSLTRFLLFLQLSSTSHLQPALKLGKLGINLKVSAAQASALHH